MWIFVKGDALKSFLEIRPAAAAFFRLIYDFMNLHTIDECRHMIDDYARNEGTTWDVMREACNLDKVRKQTAIATPHIGGEVDREAMRLLELSDALAAVALGRNVDVQLNAGCLGALWKSWHRRTLLDPHKADTGLQRDTSRR